MTKGTSRPLSNDKGAVREKGEPGLHPTIGGTEKV